MKLLRLFLCTAGWVAWTAGAVAQTPTARTAAPQIGYVYPAGGQQGTTFTVLVGGQFLDGTTGAVFFGAGLSARILGYQRPTTQKEDEVYKAEMEALQTRRRATRQNPAAWTNEEDKRLAELRTLLGYRLNRQTAPAICEAVTLEITLAPDATPGEHELRLQTARGQSNPLVFLVGQLPEFSEPAAHPNTVAPGGKEAATSGPPQPSPVRTIVLPAVINGQIMPGEVDRIRFSATKGQRLVLAASARALIPYLADAVPGWFQATLALYDATGRELAYGDDFRFNPDPVLFYEIPADGDYVVAIKDSIYRGRQDFVYRITVGELPFITGIFPLGGRVGTQTPIETKGWNLPGKQARMDATHQSSGQLQLSLRRNQILSNTVAFALDTDPEYAESEPNGDPAQAQVLPFPGIVNGRIAQPGEHDTFRFEGRAGSEIAIEVFARRLNSSLDSILTLTDAQGNTLASNDDREDKGSGLATHHADSRLALKLPADGAYYIHLSDTQHQGGPDHAYRLQLRPLRPDFALRVTPSGLNLHSGSHAVVTVFALRKDGFTGEINLALQDRSRAFSLQGARIPPGENQVRLTLATGAQPRDQPYALALAGTAQIDGHAITHVATPADDRMQAFLYRHLVPAKTFQAQVLGRGPNARSSLQLKTPVPLKIPAGGSATFRVSVPPSRAFDHLKVELSEPPEGFTLQRFSEKGGALEVVIQTDATRIKSGQQGNLLLLLSGEPAGAKKEPANPQKKADRRQPLGFLPAVPYEIAAP
jgi:hypothetical protein